MLPVGKIAAVTKSPVAFIVEHLDSCPHCSCGDYCADGLALMRKGQQVAAAFAAGIPDVKRSRWKA